MRRICCGLGLVVLAACQPPGQDEGPGSGPAPAGPAPVVASQEPTFGWLEPPRVYALIGEHERLRLTSEQIAALDSIGEWVTEANREPNQQVRDRLAQAPRRGGRPTRVAQASTQPLVEQMARNNEAAMRGVAALLTDEQKRLACEMAAERREEVMGIGGGGNAPDPRIPGVVRNPGTGMARVRGDSLTLLRRGWIWCRPQAGPPPAARPDSAG